MNFLSNLFGKKDEPPKPSGATNAVPGDSGSRRLCPECQRALLPGSRCPFCHPQQFGEELPEGTVAMGHRPGGVTAMAGVMVAHQLAIEQGARGFVHVFEGANKGASVLLGTKVISIGRGTAENVIPLNDAGVSTRHCEIRPQTGGYGIVDCDSKNGTFVNDRRAREKQLVNGDLIAIGKTRIYVGLL